MTLDLDAYLRRIGFADLPAPDLSTLAAIHARHPAAIPFENLNPLLGWPVRLDLPSIEAKLVQGGRGGYCFEHNALLGAALSAIGFTVTGLAARVVWNAPEGAVTPRTHMILEVALPDGEVRLCDVGFGGQVLTGPLRLALDVEQETPHEPFRLVDATRPGDVSPAYLLQSKIAGEWKALYRFDRQPQLPPDYEVANHYTATSPQSHFTTTLVAARAAPDRRYTLRNRQLAVHHLGGPTERRTIEDPSELRTILETDFGIAVPNDPAVDAAFARVA
jgi:N-hydroxyarylamine O-acetyltransferase